MGGERDLISKILKVIGVLAVLLLGGAAIAVFAVPPANAVQGPVVFATSADFDAEVLKADRPVLVQFEAEWCPYCRRMKDVLQGAQESGRFNVKFRRVDIETNADLAEAYGVRMLPTLIVFNKGVQIDRVDGAVDAEDLGAWMRDIQRETSEAENTRENAE